MLEKIAKRHRRLKSFSIFAPANLIIVILPIQLFGTTVKKSPAFMKEAMPADAHQAVQDNFFGLLAEERASMADGNLAAEKAVMADEACEDRRPLQPSMPPEVDEGLMQNQRSETVSNVDILSIMDRIFKVFYHLCNAGWGSSIEI